MSPRSDPYLLVKYFVKKIYINKNLICFGILCDFFWIFKICSSYYLLEKNISFHLLDQDAAIKLL